MIMRLFLSLSGLIFCVHAYSQNLTAVDSLKRELPGTTGVKRFALLNALGFEYRYSYPDSTIYYCNKAYELGRKTGVQKELSKPLSFIGLALANKGDYTRSVDYHFRSIEVAIEQNDSIQLAYAYNNLGRMFLDQGDLQRAYENLIRSKDLFEVLNDKSGLAYVFRSLSHVYKAQKEFSHALEMAVRSLELRRQLGVPRDLATAYMELGLVYQGMKEPDEALSKFAVADSIASRVNDKVTKAEIRLGMAEVLMEEKNYEDAFRAASQVLQTVSESTNRKLFLRSSMICGRYYYEKGEDAKAVPIFEGIVSDKNAGTPLFQRDACLALYEIYKRKKDVARAQEYLSRYTALDEAFQRQNLTSQVEKLSFQLEIERKEKENDLLKANQLKNEALISKQHSQNILLVIVVVSFAALAIMLWSSWRRRKSISELLAVQNQQINFQRDEISRQNDNLSRRNQDLSILNNEKDTLMNIVAHDLKAPLNRISGLTQLMEMEGGIPSHQLDYMKRLKESTRAGLEMITDLLDVNALEEARSNPQYSTFRLSEYLKDRIRMFQVAAEAKQTKLSLDCNFTGEVSSDPDFLNRILDNLISNAIKFSPKLSNVQITGDRQDGHIIISVKDQGPGFSNEDKRMMFQKFKKLSARPTGGESSNGLGLAIVKILVERLAGEITLISTPGRGSEFIIRIPDRT